MEVENELAGFYPYVNTVLAIGGAYYITNELISAFIFLEHDMVVFISILAGIIVYANFDKQGD